MNPTNKTELAGRVAEVNLARRNTALRLLGDWARRHDLSASETVYVAWTPGPPPDALHRSEAMTRFSAPTDWLGDVEGLQVSLDGANHKLAQVERRSPHPAAVDLGIPALTPRS